MRRKPEPFNPYAAELLNADPPTKIESVAIPQEFPLCRDFTGREAIADPLDAYEQAEDFGTFSEDTGMRWESDREAMIASARQARQARLDHRADSLGKPLAEGPLAGDSSASDPAVDL